MSDQLDPNTTAPDVEAPPAAGELPPCPEPDQAVDGDGSTTTSVSDGAETCVPKKRGRYASQPEFVPDEVNTRMLRDAERRLAVARNELVLVVARVKSLRLRIKRLRIEQNQLSLEMIDTITQLEETERQLRERALASFVNADTALTDASLDHDEMLRYEAQQFIVSEVFALDAETIARVRGAEGIPWTVSLGISTTA